MLGALSLLLNGGGVAQLKTITSELNHALEGREGSARSLLTQVEVLMTQLDANKADILDAIEALNRLSVEVNRHTDAIDLALDELPSALDSLDTAARRPGQDARGAREPQRRRRAGHPGVQGRDHRRLRAARPGADPVRRRG